MLSEQDAYELVVRANRAGYQTIGDYCLELEKALRIIAAANPMGPAGRLAAKTLRGTRRPVDQASRAVAQARNHAIDQQLDDDLAEDAFKADRCTCGHTFGDHRVVSQGLNKPLGGVCLAPGCDCRRYESS